MICVTISLGGLIAAAGLASLGVMASARHSSQNAVRTIRRIGEDARGEITRSSVQMRSAALQRASEH